MTIEEKEEILSKMCLRCDDIVKLTGFSKPHVYKIMRTCRKEFKGTAGIRNDAITTVSLCDYLGLSLEDELALIIKAKKLANKNREE